VGLVWLSEPAATDREVTGAKAAQLAKALQAGLPVLPGFVLSTEESGRAVELAASTLAFGRPWRAWRSVMSEPIGADLLTQIRRASDELGASLAVRSSCPLEDSGSWSGAFASYLDIASDEVSLAVHSCWASLFSTDALARCLATGVDPPSLRMAVLVQPTLHPDAGGLASLDTHGMVTISATVGSPAPLLGGWTPGVEALESPSGTIRGTASSALPNHLLKAVAALVRRVEHEFGDNVIEWAAANDRVVLLQSRRRTSRTPEPTSNPRRRDGASVGISADLIRAVHDFRGPLGERLALPWIGGTAIDWRAVDPVSASGIGEMLTEAVGLSGQLSAEAWGQPAEIAQAQAALAISELRGLRPDDAARRLTGLKAVDAAGAARLFGIVRTIAAALVRQDVIANEAQVWGLSEQTLDNLTSHRPAIRARSHDVGACRAWEPFLFSAVVGSGEPHPGAPTVSGTGVGRLVQAGACAVAENEADTEVLYADRPLPTLAPRLWHAAALLIGTGSPAAHLVEVARALRVPTLVNCQLRRDLDGTDRFAAVDAEHGIAYVVEV